MTAPEIRINHPEPDSVIEHALKNEHRFIEDLKDYLRIPSVSAAGRGITECVEYLRDHLGGFGMNVEVLETTGNPIIIGELSGTSNKTLLLYGHYDVQPEDPIELWDYPPFDAVEEDGRIYARGAVDNKGNFFCIVKALQSYMEVHGTLPCNIKLIVEGEEEIGSPSLDPFLKEHKERLAADAMIWFDGGIHHDGRPEIALGMKGMLYVELRVRSNPRDIHSGKAPLLDNPGWRLVWALESLFSQDYRVAIDGFYDGIPPATKRDHELIATAGLNARDYAHEWSIDSLRDELLEATPAELAERLYFTPTCTITGLSSGYAGPGAKTVLPAQASAKIDFRLVAGQDPERILGLLKKHLQEHGFSDIEVLVHSMMPASRSASDAPIVDVVMNRFRTDYGEPLVKPMVEGSGPGYSFEQLGAPYVFSRLGPPEDRSHAPNEYTTRDAYRRGIALVIRLLSDYSDTTLAAEPQKEGLQE